MFNLDGFEGWLQDNGAGQKSIVSYLGDVRGLLEWIQGQEAEAAGLSRELLTQYFNANSMADSTRNRKIVSFKKFAQYLIDSGQARHNPFDKAPKDLRQRAIANQEIKWLTPEKVNKLLSDLYKPDRQGQRKKSEFARLRDYTIAVVILNLGLRVSEICDLKWQDINFERELLLVKASKHNKSRYIPINQAVSDKLLDWHFAEKKHKSEYVFSSQKGEKLDPSAIQRVFSQFGYTPHQLRHTCLKSLADAGQPINVIQQYAGHNDISSTQIYIKASKDDLRKAAKKLNFV